MKTPIMVQSFPADHQDLQGIFMQTEDADAVLPLHRRTLMNIVQNKGHLETLTDAGFWHIFL